MSITTHYQIPNLWTPNTEHPYYTTTLLGWSTNFSQQLITKHDFLNY